jgi:hypothetical protein
MGRWRSAAGLLLLQLLAGVHAAEEAVVSDDNTYTLKYDWRKS